MEEAKRQKALHTLWLFLSACRRAPKHFLPSGIMQSVWRLSFSFLKRDSTIDGWVAGNDCCSQSVGYILMPV